MHSERSPPHAPPHPPPPPNTPGVSIIPLPHSLPPDCCIITASLTPPPTHTPQHPPTPLQALLHRRAASRQAFVASELLRAAEQIVRCVAEKHQ
jgi:hypothetical protein